jgi:hypothetical protein
MFKRTLIAFTALCFLFALASVVPAQETAKETKKAEVVKHEYVGADKCKMCHKKDGVYPSWAETPHAKAWESLKPEEQKNNECVGCHSTGTLTDGTLLEGVQCEACHGPGNDYRKMNIMKDLKLAMANGLLLPNEETCLKCHNDKVPEQFRSKEKFDFEKMKAKGVHAMPTKEEPQKETESE